MKTIRLDTIDKDDILSGVYASGRLGYMLCTAEKGGTAKQLCEVFSCREIVIGKIPKLLEEKTLPTRNTWMAIHKKVGTERDHTTVNFEQHAKNAIRLISHFENRNKWFSSKLYKAEHTRSCKNHIYILKSSRWWLTSPHTLSLYLLLLRIADQKDFNGLSKNTSNESVIKLITGISNYNADYERTKKAVMWNTLLDNRLAIFGKKGPKENFGIVAKFGSYEGILTLTEGKCEDKETYNKFAALYKESCKLKTN